MSLARTGPPKRRSGPINQVSEKRRKRIDESKGWRDEMRARGCLFQGPDCGGSTAVHEIVRRSAMTGAETMPELCVPLCNGVHHQWDSADMERAERVGIRIPRWAYDNDPADTVAWAARARLAYRARGKLSIPPWWTDGKWSRGS